MVQTALVGTLAVYVVVALLLVSLNIFSLWRWWVKAAAILITTACFMFAYFSITAMIGWPTFTALPQHFNLVATRIVEPDRTTGAPGHVYLWVEEINANNVPIGAPRGYEMPYDVHLADNSRDAQTALNSGKQIMGTTRSAGIPASSDAKPGKPGQNAGQMAGNPGQGAAASGETTAAETIGEGALVTFSDMPAVTLPDKAYIVPPIQ